MSPEWVTAFASLATFVVIGASAIAALAQLRHMRNNNQITVFAEIRHQMDKPEFREAIRFVRYDVPAGISDSGFRIRMLDAASEEWQKAGTVGNFIDGAIAPLVKHGMVDRDLACDLFYYPVVMAWDTLAPVISSRRAQLGYRLWEEFEYLALLCKNFRKRFPHGTYPRSSPALPLPEPWPEIANTTDSNDE